MRGRGVARERRVIAGVDRLDHATDGRERESTAGLENAEVADFHAALGPDMREESADKFDGVTGRGAEACTAHLPGGASDDAVRQADETVVGDGDLEDIGGQGGEGGAAMVVGLTVDVPGEGPALRRDVVQPSALGHGVCEEGAGDGGEGCDRDKNVSAGGPPGRTVPGAAPPRDNRGDVGVVLEVPAPRLQPPGAPREVCPDEACVGGEPFQGDRRGGGHGVVREALLGAAAGSACRRDRQGEEEVRPRELCVAVVLEPLRGLMLLALGAVAATTGMTWRDVAPHRWRTESGGARSGHCDRIGWP